MVKNNNVKLKLKNDEKQDGKIRENKNINRVALFYPSLHCSITNPIN